LTSFPASLRQYNHLDRSIVHSPKVESTLITGEALSALLVSWKSLQSCSLTRWCAAAPGSYPPPSQRNESTATAESVGKLPTAEGKVVNPRVGSRWLFAFAALSELPLERQPRTECGCLFRKTSGPVRPATRLVRSNTLKHRPGIGVEPVVGAVPLHSRPVIPVIVGIPVVVGVGVRRLPRSACAP
jgi:hypothetical protein